MIDECLRLFRRNFPYVIRKECDVRALFSHKECELLGQKNEKGELVAALLLHQNTVLMLCVDKAYRQKGIGSALLLSAEEKIRKAGYREVLLGAGFSYLMPGVPMHTPVFPSESEPSLAPSWEDCSSFFIKRGYCHAWACNCFDMICEPIPTEEERESHGITLRLAKENDSDAVCEAMREAHPSFLKYYQNAALYEKEAESRVLVALDGERVVGALILSLDEDGIGSVGCVAVLQTHRGRGVATQLVRHATHFLGCRGMKKAFVGYTYSGLEKLYGKSGYRISCYYFMAKKEWQ